MRKMVLAISLVLSLLSLNVFAFKFKMNRYLNTYSKEFDILTLGLGMEILFRDFNGFYMEYTYISTISSEFNCTKLPSIIRGFQLSAGMRLRLPLIRPSNRSKFNFYANGGFRSIRGYRREFEIESRGKASSLTVGGGLTFWHKKNGLRLEVMKDFLGKAVGFVDNDKVFKGIRFVLMGVRKF